MGEKSLFKKAIALAIITVFFSTSILPSISSIDIENYEQKNIITQNREELEKKVTVTCYNFGMPGYNLKSTLFVLMQMIQKYDFEYSIVFFTVEDDMVPCDTSCHLKMSQEKPEEYEQFIKNIQEYIDNEHLKGEENYKNNFHNQFESTIIDKQLYKKTQLIFYTIVDSPYIKSDLESVYKEYGILYFYQINCSPKELCQVPDDGHFSAYYHDLLSDNLVKIIETNNY